MRRAALSFGAAALAGVAVAASLPPVGIWPLGIGGIAMFAATLRDRGGLARAARGGVFGLFWFAIGLAFVWHFSVVGFVALIALESCAIAAAGICAGPKGRVGALAGALVLAEWARGSFPFGGEPLAALALGQADGPLACLARLGGPFLVTFGACVLGGSLAGAFDRARTRRSRRSRRGQPRRRAALGLRVLSVVLLALFVSATLAARGGPAVRSIRVAAVQGGGPRGIASLESTQAATLAATIAATSRVSGRVALLVWPEDVVSLTQSIASSPVRPVLSATARHTHATLLVGVTEPVGTRRFRNEILAFSPSGRLVARFEKVRAVPFGEFVPLRGVLEHLVSLAAVPRDEIPGAGTGMIETPVGRLGLLVSYETFFAERGRAATRAGAQLLVTETNTASYATSQVPAEELAASRIQAIAEGRDLVQAATTGYSAVLDPVGNVVVRSGLGASSVIERRVALRDGATVYERFGDTPTLVLSCILVVFALRRRRRWRARSNEAQRS